MRKLSATLCSATLVFFALGALSTLTSCGAAANGSASQSTTPTVAIVANPSAITQGSSSTLSVTASNATQVVVSDTTDSNTFTLAGSGGTQKVTPTSNTTYTATAPGAGGTVTAKVTISVTAASGVPTVAIVANPAAITQGGSSTLTVTASNATQVVISDNVDSTTYTLSGTGGTQAVSPATSTTYTATATGAGGTATATASVTVNPPGTVNSVNHVIFMMQENRSFDTYFGMLNPYRKANGWNVGDDGNTYNVDGIDDKLTTTANADDEGTSFSLCHTLSSRL